MTPDPALEAETEGMEGKRRECGKRKRRAEGDDIFVFTVTIVIFSLQHYSSAIAVP